MTTFFKKAMLYLGLGSDEDFLGMDPEKQSEQRNDTGITIQPPPGVNVRTISNSSPNEGNATANKGREGVKITEVPKSRVVKPHVVTPIRFAEVKDISDAARRSQPVIVNLQQAEHDVAVRIIDFCSGLKMGIDGQFEKAGADVFLLTPKNVEVSADEKKKLAANKALPL